MFPNRRVPQALQALGVALGALLLVETGIVASSGDVEIAFLVGAVTSLPAVLGLVYGGRYLRESALSSARYSRVLAWCLGGLAGFVAVNVGIMGTLPPGSTIILVGWLRWAAALGGGVGLLIGVFEARSIERATRAERESVHAEAERARRELLDDLNDLLRHEVLNASQVIDGYAAKLRTEYDLEEAAREDLEVIQQRSANLTGTIEEIRGLIDATRDGRRGEAADLETILREEVTSLRERGERVTVETDVESVDVYGGAVLPHVFADLLSQAAEGDSGGSNADDPDARVNVTPVSASTAEVRITTTGSFAAANRSKLFIPADEALDHGVKRSLVGTLADQYDITIERENTDGEDAAVRVTIPRASDDDGRRVEPPPES